MNVVHHNIISSNLDTFWSADLLQSKTEHIEYVTSMHFSSLVCIHKYAVKRNDDRNGIAVHAQRSGHRVNREAAQIRAMEDHSKKDGV